MFTPNPKNTPTHSPKTTKSSKNNLISKNVPLSDKNWFKTGGPARYFCQPQTTGQLQQALAFAHKHTLSMFVLGSGANSLVADEGFDGLVIRPALTNIWQKPLDADHALVTAQAGVQLEDLVTYCLEQNLSGLEEFSGIPGTVGGAVYINLHYFEFFLEHFLVSADVIKKTTGELKTVEPSWFAFGYNQSTLLKEAHFLVSACFKLKKIDDQQAAYAKGRRAEIIRHRATRYPKNNTCGSFFRNFHTEEIAQLANGKHIRHVAYYLDKLGVKGALRIGGAHVSEQHANMIVNEGNATSADIVQVARRMQTLVYEAFGLIPQPECRLIGFKHYPFLANIN